MLTRCQIWWLHYYCTLLFHYNNRKNLSPLFTELTSFSWLQASSTRTEFRLEDNLYICAEPQPVHLRRKIGMKWLTSKLTFEAINSNTSIKEVCFDNGGMNRNNGGSLVDLRDRDRWLTSVKLGSCSISENVCRYEQDLFLGEECERADFDDDYAYALTFLNVCVQLQSAVEEGKKGETCGNLWELFELWWSNNLLIWNHSGAVDFIVTAYEWDSSDSSFASHALNYNLSIRPNTFSLHTARMWDSRVYFSIGSA